MVLPTNTQTTSMNKNKFKLNEAIETKMKHQSTTLNGSSQKCEYVYLVDKPDDTDKF